MNKRNTTEFVKSDKIKITNLISSVNKKLNIILQCETFESVSKG